ncbi:hypothetical protein J8281_16850 [Aquimarina sp. U1-2]|uniref:hypothetical protein n=1 Tax=Aquimarina sp. U1-2 TaxID=2823141 RepID=UPI001AECE5CE|nr:hypothetical protein [Aquimarina sp. U1-2]MBP2833867.1 hypothetical protein [Aquimarina sp. U1-2]
MSQENQNEEIDLMQLFGMIKEFFRKVLRLVISIIDFYRKKWLLFVILAVVGLGIGYFMDQYQDTKNKYVQEIIIEPKYESTEYIYDFIEDLENNLKDSLYVKELGLQIAEVENVKKILLEPIIVAEEVLTGLEKNGGEATFIEAYDEATLKEKRFRTFYKEHKLTFIFRIKQSSNRKVSKSILDYLKANQHFKERIALELQQVQSGLAQNRKSLDFINKYLANLSQNPAQTDGKIIFASESETPTISSLLKRKQDLISKIKSDEKALALDKEVFTIMNYGSIVTQRKILVNRMLFTVPLFLIGLVSLLYALRYLMRSASSFVQEEKYPVAK